MIRKLFFFVKSSGQNTSAKCEAAPPPSLRERGAGRTSGAAAISLHLCGVSCSLPWPQPQKAAVCQQSSFSTATIPQISLLFFTNTTPHSFPEVQNLRRPVAEATHRLPTLRLPWAGSPLLCRLAALGVCLNPVPKDGPPILECQMRPGPVEDCSSASQIPHPFLAVE